MILDDEETSDELVRRSFDDLHRIAESLERIAANNPSGQMIINHLSEVALQIGNAVRKFRG